MLAGHRKEGLRAESTWKAALSRAFFHLIGCHFQVTYLDLVKAGGAVTCCRANPLPGDSQVTFNSVTSPTREEALSASEAPVTLPLEAAGGGRELKLFLVKALDKCHTASALVLSGT